ncbi:endonuclease/exonuclease/phosphatase family protein [Paenarthrobacter sp. Z7-10]|nr:endonuclease/exonuclease/phosphatase family protein [Paenarthrobacter sp. Z7-10]
MSDAVFHWFTTPSGQVRGLKSGTTYYAKVRVITATGASLSAYSGAVAGKTSSAPTPLPAISHPLLVASYNIKCANCNDGLANELTWSGRRAAVVATIKSKAPDVIGLQEASQGWLKDDSRPGGLAQFEDLQQRLKSAGVPYALTNAKRNNCVKDTTPTNCVYSNNGASQGTKIMYNANTVSLVSQGSIKLPALKAADNQRYLAWAVLKQKSTGKTFFFGDTQLDASKTSGYYDLRKRQTQAIVADIVKLNVNHLPALMVGDFNSHKWTLPSNAPYDVMMGANFVDPLGNTYQNDIPSAAATAEVRIRSNYDSFNGFERRARARNTSGNGTYLDYIFTSKMRVSKWETVLNIDTNGNFIGTIPSDHNMVDATVQLP